MSIDEDRSKDCGHDCVPFRKLRAIKEQNGYCHNSDWDITKFDDGTASIGVNMEYGINIAYCPFCGEKLGKIEFKEEIKELER